MKMGVVVSTKNAHIRRYILPDHEGELSAGHCGTGETLIVVERDPFKHWHENEAVVHAEIERVLGKKPADSRCAVVDPDTRKVVGLIKADADIDKIDGFVLVNHPTAEVGDTL